MFQVSAGAALEDYVRWRDGEIPDDFPAWMPGVVSFCDFGCAMWALLDCRTSVRQIRFPDQSTLHRLDLNLARWFESRLAGEFDMHKLIAADEARPAHTLRSSAVDGTGRTQASDALAGGAGVPTRAQQSNTDQQMSFRNR